MPVGDFLLVLHAHLPFVRHPEEPVFLEESWLFEAITETYIPLLERFERLHREGVPARVTMTWSPPLCEMLVDPLLMQRYRHCCERLLELAEQEVPAKAHSPFAEAAVMYRDHYRFCLQMLERHGTIIAWVRKLVEAGVIEPITCGATHGYLPLMLTPQARNAQIAVAVANYRKHFGCDPRGIWLPECGYEPGIEDQLKAHGLRYFFLEAHGVYYADPRPRYGVYSPVYTANGVAAFGRDPESSRSVWSSQVGYPGAPQYREFYRDLGYDGDYDYISGFLHPDGVRRNLGLKYHAVTGRVPLDQKAPYVPSQAFALAMEHGEHFARARVHQCRHLKHILNRTPVIVSPYDAELFGHWWFEGPQFIESAMRAIHHSGELRAVSASQYLREHPMQQVVRPCASSWGDNGNNGVWLNPGNDWIYRHLHAAEFRMRDCARARPEATGLERRALQQMARELLLAQSSDWGFIMTTGTSPAYATRRVRDHVNRFTGLYEALESGHLREDMLTEMEWRDSIFQEIDYHVYA